MPHFEQLPLAEAQARSATGKRAQILNEYLQYVESVPTGQAGQLRAGVGETLNAVRRRLGAAAKAAGKTIVIRRADDVVYFWVQARNGRRRRTTRAG